MVFLLLCTFCITTLRLSYLSVFLLILLHRAILSKQSEELVEASAPPAIFGDSVPRLGPRRSVLELHGAGTAFSRAAFD